MNQWSLVVALGLMIGGCAEGIDDPLPPEPTAPAPRAPAAETLSGELPIKGQTTTVDFEAPPLTYVSPSLGPIPEPGQTGN